jgi:hypothetical protein
MSDIATGASISAIAAFGGAIIALIGSLGAQLISTRSALKLKHAELLFNQKIKAYESLLTHANEFNAEPKQGDRYVRLLTSLKAASLISPPHIAALLDNKKRTSLIGVANRLRFAADQREINQLQMNEWHQMIESITAAMREDISSGLRRTPAS